MNDEQWGLLFTPEFKDWFGDWTQVDIRLQEAIDNGQIQSNDYSKRNPIIKDDEGYIANPIYKGVSKVMIARRPKIVYHATNSLNTFYTFKENQAHFFAELLDKAKTYGKRIIPAYLDIKKPFIWDASCNSFNESYGLVTSFEIALIEANRTKNEQVVSRSWAEYVIPPDCDGIIIQNIVDTLEQGDDFSEEEYDEWVREYCSTIYIVANSNQIKLADGSNTTFDGENPDIRFKEGGRTISQTPAPKKEQIYGSEKNKPESSKDTKSAEKIEFSEQTLESIKNKVEAHNQKYPRKKVTLSSAKAVVRRGMGAYSSSHRPRIKGGKPNSRVAWGLARLNAFLYKILNGKSKSGKYNQDDDLIKELGYKVRKYKGGGEIKTEYQFRDIGGSIVYYKRESNGNWLFISKDEFDQNANKNNIILFNSEMENNQKDTITMDVPLFIRMLELAREDIKSDEELHEVVERVLDIKDKVLTMDDYDYFVQKNTQDSEENMIWNVHILTGDNRLIHRRYDYPVTHEDIYNEYKNKGVEVVNTQIHHAKPIEYFAFLTSETKDYVLKKYGEEADEQSIMIKSYQKGNEYIADEIHGETISGKPFDITPAQLFETTYETGGSVGKILKRPDARLYFYIYNDAYGTMELGSDRVEMKGSTYTSVASGVFSKLEDCLYAFINFCHSEWMQVIIRDYIYTKFEVRSAFYDGISEDKYGDIVKKEKTILSISAKTLAEYIELEKFAGGGQTEAQKEKIAKVMHEFKEGELETSYGEKVTNPKQAIAIALTSANVKRMEDGGRAESIHYKDGDIAIHLSEHWYDKDSEVELVPVSELVKFREFDRKITPKWNEDDSKNNINLLKNKFKKEGIKEPLMIEYNAEDKSVLLIEGNHRLNSAVDMGLEYLPARVVLKKYGKYDKRRKKSAMPVSGIGSDEYGYIPSNLKPSQVGIQGTQPLVYEEGGVIEGQLHSECNEPHGCGEKFQVGEGGHVIEAERDEAVIVSEAFKDNSNYEITGTPSEIASALNVLGNGKNFDKGATVKDSEGKVVDLPEMKTEAKDTDVEPVIESGSIIINRRSMADDKEYTVEGTPRQIASAINSLDGNGVVIEEGAKIE